ncbi:MAG: SprT family zinc-dependent metalloprotease [Bdellovibrionota bacterium]
MEVISFLDREIEIIRRARRRSLTITMHSYKNISVKTNNQTSQKQIVDFLMSKKTWIEKNLAKLQHIEEQFVSPTFKEGAYFPFLGELKYLQFSSTQKSKIYFKIEDGFLVCYQPSNVSGYSALNSEIFFSKLKIFYKSEAEFYLRSRLAEWSSRIGLEPLKLNFRSNHTRWGSCSSRKHISLNWKLICQSPLLIDYVLVHELCHLRYLNHSTDFWNMVEDYFPSYREVEKILGEQVKLGHFLS